MSDRTRTGSGSRLRGGAILVIAALSATTLFSCHPASEEAQEAEPKGLWSTLKEKATDVVARVTMILVPTMPLPTPEG